MKTDIKGSSLSFIDRPGPMCTFLVMAVMFSIVILSNYPGFSAITNVLLLLQFAVFPSFFLKILRRKETAGILFFNLFILIAGIPMRGTVDVSGLVTATLWIQTGILSFMFGMLVCDYLKKPVMVAFQFFLFLLALGLSMLTPIVASGRQAGITGNANSTALLVLFLAMIIEMSLAGNASILLRIISLLYLAVSLLYGVVVSGSRKSILALLVLVMAEALRVFRKMRSKSKFLIMMILLAFAVAAGTSNMVINSARYLLIQSYRLVPNQAVARLILLIEGREEASADIRKDMVQEGFELIKKSPVVGFGNGAFAVLGGFDTYSHNNFIELMVNHGVLGLILWHLPFFFVLAGTMRRLWRKDSKEGWDIFKILMIMFAFESFAVIYNLKMAMMVYGIAVGKYLSWRRKGENALDPVY